MNNELILKVGKEQLLNLDRIVIDDLLKQIEKLQEENKQLKEEIQDLKADYGNKAQVERDLLEERIDKAINAYENFMSDEYILKILKGKNDE